jgi:ABC-type dipeptide/oligopeptide/nickel transport system permease subunit
MITKRGFLRLAVLGAAASAVAACTPAPAATSTSVPAVPSKITIAVVGMNFFADGLQDALDPRRGV